jgi:hypothetical protein
MYAIDLSARCSAEAGTARVFLLARASGIRANRKQTAA